MKNNIDEDIKIVEKAIKVLTGNDTGVTLDFEGTVQSISNVLSELETYKKIAEKLAEHISGRCHYIDAYSNSCDVIEDSCYEDKDCKQCIIDWARNEVENENEN